MKLFRVNVAYTIYVVAENQAEAGEEAIHRVKDEEPYETSAYIVKEANQIYSDWRDSIPYGDREFVNDRSCLEIFEALSKEPPTTTELEAAGQVPLFGAEP